MPSTSGRRCRGGLWRAFCMRRCGAIRSRTRSSMFKSRAASRRAIIYSQARPTFAVITVRRPVFPSAREREEGVGVITHPDLRWGRCDIKSISLLPNVLARQSAAAAGCREAWLIDQDGRVTEGSASNAYIVDASGRLITHPLDAAFSAASPDRSFSNWPAATVSRWSSGRSRWTRRMPRARRPCPAPVPGCCRSPPSMAARSAMACPATSCAG